MASARRAGSDLQPPPDRDPAGPSAGAKAAARTAPRPARPEPPPIAIREYRTGDGEPLRRLWEAVDFRSLGDDDASLRVLAQRNPGLVLVATRGADVVGSAMGG
jgi:hypothetical protein